MSSNLEGNEMLREAARILREWPSDCTKGFVCSIIKHELPDLDDSWTLGARYAVCDDLEKFVRIAEPKIPRSASAWLTWLGIVWKFKRAMLFVASSNAFRAVVLEEIVRGCRPEDLRERVEARRFEIEALAEEEPY